MFAHPARELLRALRHSRLRRCSACIRNHLYRLLPAWIGGSPGVLRLPGVQNQGLMPAWWYGVCHDADVLTGKVVQAGLLALSGPSGSMPALAKPEGHEKSSRHWCLVSGDELR
jgi:hypothetical protein